MFFERKNINVFRRQVYAVLAGTATTTASSAQWSGRIPRRTRGGCGGADGGGAVRAAKFGMAGSSTASCMFVVGGCNDNDGTLSSMERHDPAGWIRHAWEDVAPMAAARAKPRTAAAALDQRSMAVCVRAVGNDGPATNVWEAAVPLPPHDRAVVILGAILDTSCMPA